MPSRYLNQPNTPKGRRAEARVRLGIPATLILLDGHHRCRLDDLSCTGARVSLARAPSPGASGVLVVDGVEAFGMVVWSSADRCGFSFEDRVPTDNVVRLRHFADNFAENERKVLERNAREFVQGRRLA